MLTVGYCRCGIPGGSTSDKSGFMNGDNNRASLIFLGMVSNEIGDDVIYGVALWNRPYDIDIT